MELINRDVTYAYEIKVNRLFIARRGSENEPGNVAVYLARQLRGEPLNKIEGPFNFRRNSSVSSVLERGKEKRFKND